MASIIEGYNYDVFISYRQKDNKGDRWVSEFVEALKTELDSTFKEEVSVYFDINPHDGLLETHDVSDSLKEKLKCLVFIPVISRTYCDPHSFAWEHEFKAFIELAGNDSLGLKVRLPYGNVGTRVLPVKIHELDKSDQDLCENVLGGVLRGIDFIYKSAGVNRPLRMNEDNPKENQNHTYYRDQINKVANGIRDIILALRDKDPGSPSINQKPHLSEQITKEGWLREQVKKPGVKKVLVTFFLLISVLAVIITTQQGSAEADYSVAVVPLINYGDETLANDAGNFVEVVHDRLRLIRHISLTSSFSMLQYIDSKKPLETISRETKANIFITGSIKRESGKPVIRVELSNVRPNKSLWSKTYNWEENEIPVIIQDLILNITDNLNLKLSAEELRNVNRQLTDDPDANLNYFSANAITNDATFNFYYGSKLRDSIGFISAIRSYDKAIAADPYFAEAYAKRSIAISWGIFTDQVDSSFIPQCKSDAEKAVQLKSELPEGQIALGFYYYYCVKDQLKKALEYFQKATEMDPEDYHQLFYMAIVYRKMGEWEKSMKLIHRVIKHDPAEALFLTNIGLSYHYLHDYDSAILFHQKAIDVMPSWPDAYLNKVSSLLLRNGVSDEAWKTLNDATIKTGQDHREYRISLFLAEHNFEKARYETNLLPDERIGEKYFLRATILSGSDNIYTARKFYDSAAVVFEQQSRMYPSNPYIFMKLALCYTGSGDHKKGIEFAEKALKLSKGSSMDEADMKTAYVQILTETGKHEEALILLEELLDKPSLISVNSLKTEKIYEPLRNTVRYREILNKYARN